jgi:hypothetical protein
VAEAEVAAAEHLVAADLLQRRRHRSIHAGASPSGTVCGGDVEKGGRELATGVGVGCGRRERMILEDDGARRRKRELSMGWTGLTRPDYGLEVCRTGRTD